MAAPGRRGSACCRSRFLSAEPSPLLWPPPRQRPPRWGGARVPPGLPDSGGRRSDGGERGEMTGSVCWSRGWGGRKRPEGPRCCRPCPRRRDRGKPGLSGAGRGRGGPGGGSVALQADPEHGRAHGQQRQQLQPGQHWEVAESAAGLLRRVRRERRGYRCGGRMDAAGARRAPCPCHAQGDTSSHSRAPAPQRGGVTVAMGKSCRDRPGVMITSTSALSCTGKNPFRIPQQKVPSSCLVRFSTVTVNAWRVRLSQMKNQPSCNTGCSSEVMTM